MDREVILQFNKKNDGDTDCHYSISKKEVWQKFPYVAKIVENARMMITNTSNASMSATAIKVDVPFMTKDAFSAVMRMVQDERYDALISNEISHNTILSVGVKDFFDRQIGLEIGLGRDMQNIGHNHIKALILLINDVEKLEMDTLQKWMVFYLSTLIRDKTYIEIQSLLQIGSASCDEK